MPVIRLLLAAAMLVVALVAGLFAAVLVAITAVVGLVIMRFGRRSRQPHPATKRPTNSTREGAIDVEVEEVGSPHRRLPES